MMPTILNAKTPLGQIRQAMRMGYRRPSRGQYAVDTVYIGKETLIRGEVKYAQSKTAWERAGYKVIDETPHCRLQGLHCQYDAFRDDQVQPRNAKVRITPDPELIDVLAALFAINRQAKRYRDRAANHYENRNHRAARASSESKKKSYGVKGQVLHYLLESGRLKVGGYHVFGQGLCAEILRGEGYTFHRPCEAPANLDVAAARCRSIEAKPKKAKEPRLRDAWLTLAEFLEGKEKVPVFEWTMPVRTRERDWDQDDEGEDERDWDDEY